MSSGLILAPCELERFCFKIIKKQPKLSTTSAIFLLELSRQAGEVPVVQMLRSCNLDHRTHAAWVLDPLEGLIRTQKSQLDGTMRERYMVQLHDVLTVPVNSFDGITMQTIRTVLRDYHAKYRRGGLHVALILIAVFIRRLRKSSEISAYLLSSQSETSGRTRIMGRLEKMGVVQLLELDGSGDKTKLLVFPVEQQ